MVILAPEIVTRTSSSPPYVGRSGILLLFYYYLLLLLLLLLLLYFLVDIWAVGISLYMFVFGFPPFKGHILFIHIYFFFLLIYSFIYLSIYLFIYLFTSSFLYRSQHIGNLLLDSQRLPFLPSLPKPRIDRFHKADIAQGPQEETDHPRDEGPPLPH
jgi:serine/threonine protein kinase